MPRVLLIDDDENYTVGLTALLRHAGHEIGVAYTASSAVESVQKATWDVAFLDMRLPDEDGLVLIDKLASLDPLLPIIFLTGHDDTNTVVQAMRKGAMDYLTKPVNRETLCNAASAAAQFASERRSGRELPDGVTIPVGESQAWRRALELVRAAAGAPKTTVLVTGEPGVGKEVAATTLHRLSKRSAGPMISANAACFSPSLMESELFGHEAGSFTGAQRKRRGLFEQADGGFLFLDEIGELPLDLQSKLLRVLEGHPFRRVGGEEELRCDVRLICATNRNLPDLVQKGLFRADLYERLRVFEIHLPPLRERRDDIPRLTHHFLARLGPELGATNPNIDHDAMEALRRHRWPGNVRELRNVIERALVLSQGAPISLRHLPHELWDHRVDAPAATSPQPATSVSLEEVTRRHIEAVFQQTGGNVTHTADRLGISRLALRKRLQAYGLKPVRS